MDFSEFSKWLVEELKQRRPDHNIEIRDVEKLQNESYTGLVYQKKDSNLGVTMSLNNLFAAYERGRDPESIIQQALREGDDALRNAPAFETQRLTDYTAMREKLTMQLIPAEQNHDMLQNVPHDRLEDMAVVYRFMLSETDRGISTILITDDVMNSLGVSFEQIKADAAEYAPANNPAKLRNMSEILREMSGGLFDPDPSPLWVATVESGVNGASTLAYPGFLERAAEQLGGNFYVLPSSIHEVILVPESADGMRAQELSGMVSSINASEVDPSDRLSDVAYHFDADSKLFEKAADYEQRITQSPEHTETMRVLLVNPGEYPREVQIGTRLDDLQQAVGGMIEVVYPFEEQVGLIVNEEGKINGLELNRALRDDNGDIYDVVAGPMLVVGLTEDDFGSLSPDQAQKFEKLFHQPEAFIRAGKGIIAVPIPDDAVKDRVADIAEHAADLGKKMTAPER